MFAMGTSAVLARRITSTRRQLFPNAVIAVSRVRLVAGRRRAVHPRPGDLDVLSAKKNSALAGNDRARRMTNAAYLF
jgi:hypothetical protein